MSAHQTVYQFGDPRNGRESKRLCVCVCVCVYKAENTLIPLKGTDPP